MIANATDDIELNEALVYDLHVYTKAQINGLHLDIRRNVHNRFHTLQPLEYITSVERVQIITLFRRRSCFNTQSV